MKKISAPHSLRGANTVNLALIGMSGAGKSYWSKKMKEKGIDPVIFGLSDNDFKLLAKNFAQIRAHMMKLNVMIDEYKDYYESDVINKDKQQEQETK